MQNGHAHPLSLSNAPQRHSSSSQISGSKHRRKTVTVTKTSSQNNILLSTSGNLSNIDNSNNNSNERNLHSSSSSSEEDSQDVVKECQRLQRQRSSIAVFQNGLYDYRLPILSIHGQASRKRKLILHVDVRNTILVADSITNVSVEEALNSFLTAVVWGKEVDGAWKWFSDVPSLKRPSLGVKTYYKYLEEKLVSNEEDRVNLRLTTGDFVHTCRGQQFLKHFNVHLARLAWEHAEEPLDKVLTMSGKDGRPYHYILPSFYKLLQYLTHRKRDFAIVLRTYGRDGENVLSSLKYGTQGNHPAFQTSLNLPVHKTPGIINRTRSGFVLRTFKSKNHSETLQMVTHERDLYRHFCSLKGISGFVDDFCAWQRKNYHHKWGKPFWIDLSDTRHHHIFFDDNFRNDDEDSIVDVRLFTRENPAAPQSLTLGEIQRFENACLVQADLLESIADESYFIRMVRMCEDMYSRLLNEDNL